MTDLDLIIRSIDSWLWMTDMDGTNSHECFFVGEGVACGGGIRGGTTW